MQRKRIIILVVSAACGALIGALATMFKGHIPTFAAFRPDEALLVHRRLLVAAAACWVLFSLYWEVAARNAAKAKSSESRVSRFFHVSLTNVALLLEIAPIRGLGRFLPVSVVIMASGLAIEA